jgi:hypothetical protein
MTALYRIRFKVGVENRRGPGSRASLRIGCSEKLLNVAPQLRVAVSGYRRSGTPLDGLAEG